MLDRGVKGLEVIIFFDFYHAAHVEKITQGSERGKIVLCGLSLTPDAIDATEGTVSDDTAR